MSFVASVSSGALFASSVFLGVLALCFLVGDHLRPAWGLRWFGVAMVLSLVRSVGALGLMTAQPWWLVAAAVLAAGTLAALFVGLRAYLAQPLRAPLLAFVAGIGVWFVLRAGWQAVGLGSLAGPFASGLMFVYLSALCLRPLRLYAGRAYGLVAFVLIFHPVFLLGVGLGVFGADMQQLRGWSTLGTSIVGLGLLMAAMGRLRVDLEQEIARRCQAEASLREANDSLEVRVKDRTAELEGLVSDLESFNRMVSHDLRGPLGGVQGVIDLALQGLQGGDHRRVQRYLEVIRVEAERLGRLVDQLLMLARVTQVQLERCETPLSEILDQALDTLRLSHGAEAVSSVVALPLPSVTVDPVLLSQVFVNLVGNALKFAGRQARPEVLVRSVDTDR